MLGDVEVDKVTEVVVHVHPYYKTHSYYLCHHVTSIAITYSINNSIYYYMTLLQKYHHSVSMCRKDHVFSTILRCNKNKWFCNLVQLSHKSITYQHLVS